MDLIHTLNGVVIEEPIGFDSMKTSIKRHEYHGIGAEVTIGDLEFYGEAVKIIRNAYNADIDTEVNYRVVTQDGVEVYHGRVDLSTYTEIISKYNSISCKVGEIGVKTTFNVRTSAELNLNSSQTIDGNQLVFNPEWIKVNIPRKHLRYTNIFKQTYTKTIKKDKEDEDLKLLEGARSYITIPVNDVYGEFGDTNNGDCVVAEYSGSFTLENATKMYSAGDHDEFKEEYGDNVTCESSLRFNVQIKFLESIIKEDSRWDEVDVTLLYGVGDYTGGVYNYISPIVFQSTTTKVKKGDTPTIDLFFENDNFKDSAIGNKNGGKFLFIDINLQNLSNEHIAAAKFELTINKGTEYKMVMTDNLVNDLAITDMLPIHESLNKIAGMISENQLCVRSDWYGRLDSQIEPISQFGGGSLKAITNGYKIRELAADEENSRSMQVSFKQLIQDLNVIDCVGWGFSNEADGKLCVRVERWDWFYKQDVLLQINDVNEIKRSINNDNIYNQLVIGYTKYKTSEEYNSIDSVFGERVFMSPLKSISNEKNLKCAMVADNYAIEETRRARVRKNETEETTYDESIFVFELSCKWNVDLNAGTIDIYDYEVVNNIVSASGVARPDEQINVQLSPRRCAERWRSYLFATNNTLPYRFISGKINCNAEFECNSTHTTQGYEQQEYLQDFANNNGMLENKTIDYQKTSLKAEILEFTYPLTIEEINIIRNNPYGIIKVNNEECWIKEITINVIDGECEFKLIPKSK